jgi:YbbR domain-containing protein
LNSRKFLLKITEKWPAKVISVAAALIISVFYRLNTLDSRIITVPLRVEASSNFIPTHSLSNSARITMRGEANNITTITEEDIEAFIDLNRYTKAGTHRVPIQIRKRGNALGVEPLEISVSPAEIYITLEEKISRFIHVFPVFYGTTAPGFELTNLSIIPESVIAEGPRSSLENLKEFTTAPIDIEGRSSNFTMLVNINNDKPDITIQGNRMVEFNGTISRIERLAPIVFTETYEAEKEKEEE